MAENEPSLKEVLVKAMPDQTRRVAMAILRTRVDGVSDLPDETVWMICSDRSILLCREMAEAAIAAMGVAQ